MKKLRIPLALDESSRIVDPDAANKDTAYYCPSCGDSLVLRKGQVKKPHFSHKVSDSCSQETVIHKLAKFLIIQNIKDWKVGQGDVPLMKRKCPDCGEEHVQEFPDKVDSAVDEVRLESGYVADVGIYSNQKIVAAIEIKVYHQVSDVKKTNIGIPFIELLGEQVIENPAEWNPVIDMFKPFKCSKCDQALKKYNEKLVQISVQTKVAIPGTFYRTAYCDCWKCSREILLFMWPNDDSLHSYDLPLNVPRPRTIQFRYSKTAGTKYWANTCPYCKNIQGDFFLYSEPDSLLFGFHCGENSQKGYKKDMKQLAIRYFHGY